MEIPFTPEKEAKFEQDYEQTRPPVKPPIRIHIPDYDKTVEFPADMKLDEITPIIERDFPKRPFVNALKGAVQTAGKAADVEMGGGKAMASVIEPFVSLGSDMATWITDAATRASVYSKARNAGHPPDVAQKYAEEMGKQAANKLTYEPETFLGKTAKEHAIDPFFEVLGNAITPVENMTVDMARKQVKSYLKRDMSYDEETTFRFLFQAIAFDMAMKGTGKAVSGVVKKIPRPIREMEGMVGEMDQETSSFGGYSNPRVSEEAKLGNPQNWKLAVEPDSLRSAIGEKRMGAEYAEDMQAQAGRTRPVEENRLRYQMRMKAEAEQNYAREQEYKSRQELGGAEEGPVNRIPSTRKTRKQQIEDIFARKETTAEKVPFPGIRDVTGLADDRSPDTVQGIRDRMRVREEAEQQRRTELRERLDKGEAYWRDLNINDKGLFSALEQLKYHDRETAAKTEKFVTDVKQDTTLYVSQGRLTIDELTKNQKDMFSAREMADLERRDATIQRNGALSLAEMERGNTGRLTSLDMSNAKAYVTRQITTGAWRIEDLPAHAEQLFPGVELAEIRRVARMQAAQLHPEETQSFNTARAEWEQGLERGRKALIALENGVAFKGEAERILARDYITNRFIEGNWDITDLSQIERSVFTESEWKNISNNFKPEKLGSNDMTPSERRAGEKAAGSELRREFEEGLQKEETIQSERKTQFTRFMESPLKDRLQYIKEQAQELSERERRTLHTDRLPVGNQDAAWLMPDGNVLVVREGGHWQYIHDMFAEKIMEKFDIGGGRAGTIFFNMGMVRWWNTADNTPGRAPKYLIEINEALSKPQINTLIKSVKQFPANVKIHVSWNNLDRKLMDRDLYNAEVRNAAEFKSTLTQSNKYMDGSMTLRADWEKTPADAQRQVAIIRAALARDKITLDEWLDKSKAPANVRENIKKAFEAPGSQAPSGTSAAPPPKAGPVVPSKVAGIESQKLIDDYRKQISTITTKEDYASLSLKIANDPLVSNISEFGKEKISSKQQLLNELTDHLTEKVLPASLAAGTDLAKQRFGMLVGSYYSKVEILQERIKIARLLKDVNELIKKGNEEGITKEQFEADAKVYTRLIGEMDDYLKNVLPLIPVALGATIYGLSDEETQAKLRGFAVKIGANGLLFASLPFAGKGLRNIAEKMKLAEAEAVYKAEGISLRTPANKEAIIRLERKTGGYTIDEHGKVWGEMPDDRMKVKAPLFTQPDVRFPMKEALHYPELFERYPFIEKDGWTLRYDSTTGENGATTSRVSKEIDVGPHTNAGELKESIIHELDHVIREYEGGQFGGRADIGGGVLYALHPENRPIFKRYLEREIQDNAGTERGKIAEDMSTVYRVLERMGDQLAKMAEEHHKSVVTISKAKVQEAIEMRPIRQKIKDLLKVDIPVEKIDAANLPVESIWGVSPRPIIRTQLDVLATQLKDIRTRYISTHWQEMKTVFDAEDSYWGAAQVAVNHLGMPQERFAQAYNELSFASYQNLSAEIQARISSDRVGMTAEELRMLPRSLQQSELIGSTEFPMRNPYEVSMQQSSLNPRLAEQVRERIAVDAELSKASGVSDITEIMKSFEALRSKKLPEEGKLDISEKLKRKLNSTEGSLGEAYENMKIISAGLIDTLMKPPTWTNFKAMFSDYLGTLQKSNFYGRQFSVEMNKIYKNHPDRAAGLSNYLQAGGDMPLLAERIKAIEAKMAEKGISAKEKERLANLLPAYRIATRLTKDEVKFAEDIKKYWEVKGQKAIEAGILEDVIDNYVTQIWKKDNNAKKSLMAKAVAGKLGTNPFLMQRRVFESYFEGEMAGYNPLNKHVGFLVSVYDRALNEAIAARGFIRSLRDAYDVQGNPLADVVGKMDKVMEIDTAKSIAEGKTKLNPRFFIKPHFAPNEMRANYEYIDHPAMRGWKVLGRDSGGNPIISQGEMWVTKDIAPYLKSLLKKSEVREWGVEIGGKKYKPAGAALEGFQELKGTLLSMSFFHQVQEGIHAVFHAVKPWGMPKIDPNNPIQNFLINHGLIVAEYKGYEVFQEGLVSGQGLAGKLLPFMRTYSSWLFEDYIPRLKMEMARHAFERNLDRYGKTLSTDQIGSITAEQSNAAFGMLNYPLLARSKTFQDIFRLCALAPDFLEARTRFVAQSFRTYGVPVSETILRKGVNWNEQFMAAAIRGALGLYAITRVTNMLMNNGDPKWDKPFSTVIGKYEFTPRSVPGDVYHLIADPRSFVYYRMNPFFTKAIVEGVTNRDEFGRYRDVQDKVVDYFAGIVPIPFQVKGQERKWWQSVFASIGVNAVKSRTSFERELLTLYNRKIVITYSREDRKRNDLVSKYSDELQDELVKNGSISVELRKKIDEDITSKKLYQEDLKRIAKRALEDKTMNLVGHSQMDILDIMEAWGKASDMEKARYYPIVRKKLENWASAHPEKAQANAEKLRETFRNDEIFFQRDMKAANVSKR